MTDPIHDPQKIIATVCDEWDRGELTEYPSVEIGRRLRSAGWRIVKGDGYPEPGRKALYITEEWTP
jgi:hypothetical protein